MNIVKYILWLFAFVAGVVVSYFVPDETLSLNGKYIFLGAWGAVLGFVFYTICKKRIDSMQSEFNEALNSRLPKTPYGSISAHDDDVLPKGAVPAAEALRQAEASLKKKLEASSKVFFPLPAWNDFKNGILKNRPFNEVIASMEKLLPVMFPNASGVLYMYGDVQTEVAQIFKFGPNVISDEHIRPEECASFNNGEVAVTDYTSPEISGNCTHLHHRPKGYALCAPIEGLEEHFGILSIQVDALPEYETLEYWQAKISVVSAAFGLFVANQDLNSRFQQHSIRDTLTGLFNRRYMEESLTREVYAAVRHNSPIGMIMIRPDAIDNIQETQGRHAVEQLLWELGQRLPSYIRGEDIPCRYNGDVFCVILPGADVQTTKDRAEKIRSEISQLQIDYNGNILATTLSMGVADMPLHAADGGALIYAAELSMQCAVKSGMDRIVLADVLSMS